MKVKIVKSFRPHPYKPFLEVSHVFEVRRLSPAVFVAFDLTTPFQIIDGEHSGKYIPFENCIVLPDHKIYSEQQYTELKQENLMRLEEVKGLQAELDKVKKSELMHRENEQVLMNQRSGLYEKNLKMDLDIKAAHLGIRNKHAELLKSYQEVSKLKTAYEAEKEARVLLEATLERALLNQQVVLPKEVAEELQHLRNEGETDYRIISDIKWRLDHYASNSISPMTKWADQHNSPFLRALADGYTVKLELPIAHELADMIQEWNNEPTFDDEDAACLALATRIAERTKEFYSKN